MLSFAAIILLYAIFILVAIILKLRRRATSHIFLKRLEVKIYLTAIQLLIRKKLASTNLWISQNQTIEQKADGRLFRSASHQELNSI